LKLVETVSSEFRELEEYLVKSHGHTHRYEIPIENSVSFLLTSLGSRLQFKVQDIFRIERHGEFDRFDKSPVAKSKASDRRLLWHGSRCTNFGGILSQGVRIAPPESPVSGYMFGKGIYLADISSKSAGYCHPELSGNHALLLLCEAELGKPMLELNNSDYNAGDLARANGRIATWGKGITGPAGWKDASCVNQSLKGVMMVRFITFNITPMR
jgi:poly [ADP-ribose] polymerase